MKQWWCCVISGVITIPEKKDDSSKPDSKSKLGDVNGDTKIDIEDAVMVIQSVNGMKALTEDETANADIDGNKTIDIEDAVRIIAYVNGIATI